MSSFISELKDLIEEYETLVIEARDMSEAWNSEDESNRACSDPGLQYELDMKIEAKTEEIIKACKEIGKESR